MSTFYNLIRHITIIIIWYSKTYSICANSYIMAFMTWSPSWWLKLVNSQHALRYKSSWYIIITTLPPKDQGASWTKDGKIDNSQRTGMFSGRLWQIWLGSRINKISIWLPKQNLKHDNSSWCYNIDEGNHTRFALYINSYRQSVTTERGIIHVSKGWGP